MQDIVYIKELRVATVIGVYGWERDVRQELLLDLEMAWNTAVPAKADDVSLALDYASVSNRLIEFANEARFQLIESFAEGVAELLQREFSVTWVQVSVAKPGAVRDAKSVGVRIVRGQTVV
ncbi:MAG: dihydroneopterin aldolase [Pseudomonadota bacterium]